MKRFQFLAALLLCAWTLNGQTKLDEAKKKIINENYSEAKKLLSEFIAGEKEPERQAEAYYWLGECEYIPLIEDNVQQAIEKAREQYNKGLAIAKNSPHCQVGMGKLLLDAKNTKEAQKTFDAALRSSKSRKYKEGHPEIYMLIGDAYLNSSQKNPEMAVANYTRARDIDPQDARYWLRLGDGSLAKKDAGGAMNAYESAAQKDKNDPEVYLKMATIWYQSQKYDLAIEKCLEGEKISNQYAPLYKLMVELYVAAKKYDKVPATLEKYLALVGDLDPQARLNFVKYLTYQVKDYDRATSEGERFAEKFGKEFPTIYRWLAWAYAEKAGKMEADKAPADDWKMIYRKSNEASLKLMQSLPADRLVNYDYEYRARSSQKTGNLDDAKSMYMEIIKLDSTRTCDILTSLLNGYNELKKYKEGFAIYEDKVAKGCKISYTEAFYEMYYAYSIKDYEMGVKYSDKYIEIVPAGADGYYFKGMCLTELDNDSLPTWKARETYEKLIQIYEAKPEDARAKTYVTKAYNYLAYYFGSQNDLVKTKEFFQKTLAIDPKNKQAMDALQQLGN